MAGMIDNTAMSSSQANGWLKLRDEPCLRQKNKQIQIAFRYITIQGASHSRRNDY